MTVEEQRYNEARPGAPPYSKSAQLSNGASEQHVASPPQPTCGPAYHSAFARRFSREGHDRQQGTLRKYASQFMGTPGVVSFSGGFPPPELFPFESISIGLRGPGGVQTVTIDDPAKVATAQQYNLALRGYPPLLRWTEQHMRELHGPPGPHEVAITNGGNHALEVLAALLLDRGDSLLVEEYTYPHWLECVAQPKGLHVLPLPIDAQGIIPEAMQELLERLRSQPPGAGAVPFPKLLYTIPTAQNPTGATITPARRRAVYELCCRHDIVILEDDPYFYLQFPAAAATPQPAPEAENGPRSPSPSSPSPSPPLAFTPSTSSSASDDASDAGSSSDGDGEQQLGEAASVRSGAVLGPRAAPDGLSPASSGALSPGLSGALSLGGSVLPPVHGAGQPGAAQATAGVEGARGAEPSSYLSLDTQGRVARIDSFAKFLSPGLRLGWLTAPPDLLAKAVMAIQAHTVGPCSLSQVVVAETLAAWGEAGLAAHVARVRETYAHKAAVMLEAAEKELTGLAEWSRPRGGMFLWLRLLGVADATHIWGELQRHKLVVLPGRAMHPRANDPTFHSPYVRISFSYATEEQVREGMRRLGQVLRAHRATLASPAPAPATTGPAL